MRTGCLKQCLDHCLYSLRDPGEIQELTFGLIPKADQPPSSPSCPSIPLRFMWDWSRVSELWHPDREPALEQGPRGRLGQLQPRWSPQHSSVVPGWMPTWKPSCTLPSRLERKLIFPKPPHFVFAAETSGRQCREGPSLAWFPPAVCFSPSAINQDRGGCTSQKGSQA